MKLSQAIKSLLVLLSMCFLLSCSGDTVIVDSTAWIDELTLNEGILGVQMGQEHDIVIGNLGKEARKEGNELVYNYTLSNGSACNQYVNFDEGKVYEITLDLFPENDSLLRVEFQQLVTHLDSKFQKSRPADGFATWKTASPSGQLVEVTLADESLEFGAPLIMLNYLENYDRTFTED